MMTNNTNITIDASKLTGAELIALATKQYGAEAVDAQLRLEATAKHKVAQDILDSYDNPKVDLSATKVGGFYVAHQVNEVTQIILEVINSVKDKKAGVIPRWHAGITVLLEAYRKATDKRKVEKDVSKLIALAIVNSFINNLHVPVAIDNHRIDVLKDISDELNFLDYIKHYAKSPVGVKLGLSYRIDASYKHDYIVACCKKDGYKRTSYNTNKDIKDAIAYIITAVISKSAYWCLASDENMETAKNKAPMQVVAPTDAFLKTWVQATKQQAALTYRYVPTIIPPLPWSSFHIGGYWGELADGCSMMRLHANNSYALEYIQELDSFDLSKVYRAINVVQGTAWRINTRVYKILKQLVAEDSGRGHLPRQVDDDDKPIKPQWDSATDAVKKAYKAANMRWHQKHNKRVGHRSRLETMISTFDILVNYPKHYYPCNLDFRGRLYYIPSINPQGDDCVRGCIEMVDAPPCKDMQDIVMLARQVAYAYGYDKASYADRYNWVIDNSADIVATAKDPLNNNRWEYEYDGTSHNKKAWQALSASMAWADWIEWRDSHNGDPAGFICHLPCAMDGTCSGTQHYSAMLRDPIGAQNVSLAPADKPSDIYQLVADKVIPMLQKDAVNGTGDETVNDKIKYGTRTLAQIWLTFGINRKICKRPTMTLAYGATLRGYAEQIKTDTIDPYILDNPEQTLVNDSNKMQLCNYLAAVIKAAVDDTVIAARQGMDWLQEVAKMVAKSGNIVSWITPMGLPIKQIYLKYKSTNYQLSCQGKRVRVYDNTCTGQIDNEAQRAGIAPNFIHSLDAAHMMATVNMCRDAGITGIMTVHDSFAVPCSQATILYRVLREAFVTQYKGKHLLDDLREYLAPLADDDLPTPPEQGTFDLDEILKSEYVFS